LMLDVKAGDEQSFELLLRKYRTPLVNFLYRMVRDTAAAEDLAQEVFLRVFRGIHGFRRGSSLKTWLYRISVRQALNHRRWCWRHHRQQVSIDAETEEKGPMLELKDEEATPFEQCATHETQAAVRRALGEVPPLFRSAVILRDLEGLSYEEIAEVLEVSVGTVKSRILRGRRTLREILDPLLHVPARQTSETADQAGRTDLRRQAKIRYVARTEILDAPRAEAIQNAETHGGER